MSGHMTCRWKTVGGGGWQKHRQKSKALSRARSPRYPASTPQAHGPLPHCALRTAHVAPHILPSPRPRIRGFRLFLPHRLSSGPTTVIVTLLLSASFRPRFVNHNSNDSYNRTASLCASGKPSSSMPISDWRMSQLHGTGWRRHLFPPGTGLVHVQASPSSCT